MATTATGITNTRTNSCVDVKLNCVEMWSLAQQFCYGRLITRTGQFKGQLLVFADVRAKRIAATYARFYLELEEGGNPELKGRYYWMALGAFASKTVACSMELARVQALPTVMSGLARGNFWLFMDIAAWHWYWNKSPGSFWMCETQRRADVCVPQVRNVMDRLPWAKESLPLINQMATNEKVHEGFALVADIEHLPARHEDRPSLQLAHLMRIAEHEQGKVLQPLIYDDPDFAFWVSLQRSKWVSWASPALQIAFVSGCDTDDPALKSVAPEETILENYKSRMRWIGRAADLFHKLMQENIEHMERELHSMANWVDLPDGRIPIPLL